METRTLPLDVWKIWESKVIFVCFGENLGEKGEKTAPEKCSKLAKIPFFFFLFFLIIWEVWGFYIFFLWLFDFLCTLSVCHPYLLPFAEISNFGFFHFLVLTSTADLDAFSDFDWPDLGGTGKILMSSFQNTWPLENQTVGLKVMASRSELMRQAWFSRFLNRFNSNFDPWEVFGDGIQYSL